MLKQFSILLLAFLTSGILAQETKVMEDLQLWIGANYTEKLLDKKLRLHAESEIRFRRNISEFKLFYVEGGVAYKVFKFMEVGGALRYTHHKTWKGNIEDLYRYNLDLKLSQDIERFTVSYRLRYQNTGDKLVKKDTASNSINIIRNRVLVKYNIKNCKLTPFISGELYTDLDLAPISHFNFRLTAGTSYPLGTISRLKLFYRIDFELDQDEPYRIYTLGTRFFF